MQQPEGFKLRGQENKVLHLHHAIYGLKQAALAWWKELESSMKDLVLNALRLMPECSLPTLARTS